MNLKNKIILTFNKFYSSLIKDLKTSNDEIKLIIKKNYKVIDKLSEEYIIFFNDQFPDIKNNDETLNEKYIVKNVTIKSVLNNVNNEIELTIFWNYFHILTTILLLYKELNENDENQDQIDLLFNKIVNIFTKIENNEEYESLIDEILDDDIRSELSKIKPINNANNTNNTNNASNNVNSDNNPFTNGSGILCNLAKEISNDIDASNIKVDKPEDILKLIDFSSSNNIVGDIIKKVSSKIHDKISNGEIKQEELFGEAMNMMGMMNLGGAKNSSGMAEMMSGLSGMMNNPAISEVMKAMKKGKAVPKQDAFKKESARDRLRAKLNLRKNKDET